MVRRFGGPGLIHVQEGNWENFRETIRGYITMTEHFYLLLVFGWISSEKDVKNPNV